MSKKKRLAVSELNPHLLCILCGGYYVDATTVIECLHTFCKSCIVRYLETSKFCPTCDVLVHKTKPILSIRPDKSLQNIVYKLVPGLFKNEMCRRKKYYSKSIAGKPSSEEDGGCHMKSEYLVPGDSVSIALTPLASLSEEHAGPNSLHTRFFNCPAGISLGLLKRLLRAKFDLPESHPVLICASKDDVLQDDLTLIDVAYMKSWKKDAPLVLFYKIYFTKRLKLDPTLEEKPIHLDCKDVTVEERCMPRLEPEVENPFLSSESAEERTLPKLSPISELVPSSTPEPIPISFTPVPPSAAVAVGTTIKAEVTVAPLATSTKGNASIPTYKTIIPAPIRPVQDLVNVNSIAIPSVDSVIGRNCAAGYGYGLGLLTHPNGSVPNLFSSSIVDQTKIGGAVLPFGLTLGPSLICAPPGVSNLNVNLSDHISGLGGLSIQSIWGQTDSGPSNVILPITNFDTSVVHSVPSQPISSIIKSEHTTLQLGQSTILPSSKVGKKPKLIRPKKREKPIKPIVVEEKEVQLMISETGVMMVNEGDKSSNPLEGLLNPVYSEANELLTKIESGSLLSLSDPYSEDSKESDISDGAEKLAQIKQEISCILSTLSSDDSQVQPEQCITNTSFQTLSVDQHTYTPTPPLVLPLPSVMEPSCLIPPVSSDKWIADTSAPLINLGKKANDCSLSPAAVGKRATDGSIPSIINATVTDGSVPGVTVGNKFTNCSILAETDVKKVKDSVPLVSPVKVRSHTPSLQVKSNDTENELVIDTKTDPVMSRVENHERDSPTSKDNGNCYIGKSKLVIDANECKKEIISPSEISSPKKTVSDERKPTPATERPLPNERTPSKPTPPKNPTHSDDRKSTPAKNNQFSDERKHLPSMNHQFKRTGRKNSQPIGYKTLKISPRGWNPTISREKLQEKLDASGPKMNKIFKARNSVGTSEVSNLLSSNCTNLISKNKDSATTNTKNSLILLPVGTNLPKDMKDDAKPSPVSSPNNAVLGNMPKLSNHLPVDIDKSSKTVKKFTPQKETVCPITTNKVDSQKKNLLETSNKISKAETNKRHKTSNTVANTPSQVRVDCSKAESQSEMDSKEKRTSSVSVTESESKVSTLRKFLPGKDNAKTSGTSIVTDNAKMLGTSSVTDNAKMSGTGFVTDDLMHKKESSTKLETVQLVKNTQVKAAPSKMEVPKSPIVSASAKVTEKKQLGKEIETTAKHIRSSSRLVDRKNDKTFTWAADRAANDPTSENDCAALNIQPIFTRNNIASNHSSSMPKEAHTTFPEIKSTKLTSTLGVVPSSLIDSSSMLQKPHIPDEDASLIGKTPKTDADNTSSKLCSGTDIKRDKLPAAENLEHTVREAKMNLSPQKNDRSVQKSSDILHEKKDGKQTTVTETPTKSDSLSCGDGKTRVDASKVSLAVSNSKKNVAPSPKRIQPETPGKQKMLKPETKGVPNVESNSTQEMVDESNVKQGHTAKQVNEKMESPTKAKKYLMPLYNSTQRTRHTSLSNNQDEDTTPKLESKPLVQVRNNKIRSCTSVDSASQSSFQILLNETTLVSNQPNSTPLNPDLGKTETDTKLNSVIANLQSGSLIKSQDYKRTQISHWSVDVSSSSAKQTLDDDSKISKEDVSHSTQTSLECVTASTSTTTTVTTCTGNEIDKQSLMPSKCNITSIINTKPSKTNDESGIVRNEMTKSFKILVGDEEAISSSGPLSSSSSFMNEVSAVQPKTSSNETSVDGRSTPATTSLHYTIANTFNSVTSAPSIPLPLESDILSFVEKNASFSPSLVASLSSLVCFPGSDNSHFIGNVPLPSTTNVEKNSSSMVPTAMGISSSVSTTTTSIEDLSSPCSASKDSSALLSVQNSSMHSPAVKEVTKETTEQQPSAGNTGDSSSVSKNSTLGSSVEVSSNVNVSLPSSNPQNLQHNPTSVTQCHNQSSLPLSSVCHHTTSSLSSTNSNSVALSQTTFSLANTHQQTQIVTCPITSKPSETSTSQSFGPSPCPQQEQVSQNTLLENSSSFPQSNNLPFQCGDGFYFNNSLQNSQMSFFNNFMPFINSAVTQGNGSSYPNPSVMNTPTCNHRQTNESKTITKPTSSEAYSRNPPLVDGTPTSTSSECPRPAVSSPFPSLSGVASLQDTSKFIQNLLSSSSVPPLADQEQQKTPNSKSSVEELDKFLLQTISSSVSESKIAEVFSTSLADCNVNEINKQGKSTTLFDSSSSEITPVSKQDLSSATSGTSSAEPNLSTSNSSTSFTAESQDVIKTSTSKPSSSPSKDHNRPSTHENSSTTNKDNQQDVRSEGIFQNLLDDSPSSFETPSVSAPASASAMSNEISKSSRVPTTTIQTTAAATATVPAVPAPLTNQYKPTYHQTTQCCKHRNESTSQNIALSSAKDQNSHRTHQQQMKASGQQMHQQQQQQQQQQQPPPQQHQQPQQQHQQQPQQQHHQHQQHHHHHQQQQQQLQQQQQHHHHHQHVNSSTSHAKKPDLLTKSGVTNSTPSTAYASYSEGSTTYHSPSTNAVDSSMTKKVERTPQSYLSSNQSSHHFPPLSLNSMMNSFQEGMSCISASNLCSPQKHSTQTASWEGNPLNPFMFNNTGDPYGFSANKSGFSPSAAASCVQQNLFRNNNSNMGTKDSNMISHSQASFNPASNALCPTKNTLGSNASQYSADSTKKTPSNIDNYDNLSVGSQKYNASLYYSNYNNNYSNFFSNSQTQGSPSLTSLVSGAGYNFPLSSSKFTSQQYLNLGQNSTNNASYFSSGNFNVNCGSNYQNCINQSPTSNSGASNMSSNFGNNFSGPLCNISLPYYSNCSISYNSYPYFYQGGDMSLLSPTASFMPPFSCLPPRSSLGSRNSSPSQSFNDFPLQSGFFPMMPFVSPLQGNGARATPSPVGAGIPHSFGARSFTPNYTSHKSGETASKNVPKAQNASGTPSAKKHRKTSSGGSKHKPPISKGSELKPASATTPFPSSGASRSHQMHPSGSASSLTPGGGTAPTHGSAESNRPNSSAKRKEKEMLS